MVIIIDLLNLIDKRVSGKSKDEQMAEKKQELEKRLQDVAVQLGNTKKQQPKKGKYYAFYRWKMYQPVSIYF